jgi:hypothetical protein
MTFAPPPEYNEPAMTFDAFNCNDPARAIRVREPAWRWWRRS